MAWNSLLCEATLAIFGLNVVDINLCHTGSRGTLVQVLLELFQRAAVTLSFSGNLKIGISKEKDVKHIMVVTNTAI